MIAKILIQGPKVWIYILVKGDEKNEIQDFFERGKNNPKLKGVVSGFIKLLDHIAIKGLKNLRPKFFKCWKQDGEIFCEVIKGKHRISCFKYERDKRLLLITHFMKKKDKEEREYKRAINLKKTFDKDGVWDDE